MKSVYIFVFDAQWREDKDIIQGKQAFPVTVAQGNELDAAHAIIACRVLAATGGTILYPERGVDVRTFLWDMSQTELQWSDGWVGIY